MTLCFMDSKWTHLCPNKEKNGLSRGPWSWLSSPLPNAAPQGRAVSCDMDPCCCVTRPAVSSSLMPHGL